MIPKRTNIDIDKRYSTTETVKRLRRLADCLESGKPYKIQIGGERVTVPNRAVFALEHETKGNCKEIAFQFRWASYANNSDISLEIDEQSISINSKRRQLGSEKRFRNVQKIREFVEESLDDGVSWTCERETPHFRYKDITYYLNGDSVGYGNEAKDAIALPWFELEEREKTEEDIKDVIESESLKIADPKPKSKKKMGPGENRGGYLSIEISSWKDMRAIFDSINNE